MGARGIAVLSIVILSHSLVPQSVPRHELQFAPLLYTVAREYNPLAWIAGGERFPRGAGIFVRSGESSRQLISGFFATADPNVSFDGTRVLFSGKRGARAVWQIWEISVATGRLRQITHCDGDCIRPLYVPADRLVYARKSDGRFVLEIGSLSTAEIPLRLSHAPGNYLPSDVLRDGRVLFQAAYPLDDKALPELYTVYTDGSGVESYRCDHGHPRYAGKQVASGDVVFTRGDALFRFTSAIAHEVAVPAPAGSYAGDVIENRDGSWLVSLRGPERRFFELREWKPRAATSDLIMAAPRAHVVQPVLLAPRAVPNRHPSGLHDWNYANVLCLNAYTSKEHFAEGSIASVHLYTRGAAGLAQLLGSAQVEKDGSFYLRVPGDRPLKIELLDQSGKTLRKEAGWFWMRGGEQRVCVGCHAGPETAPDNAVPAVLLRSTVAADMTGTSSPSAGGH